MLKSPATFCDLELLRGIRGTFRDDTFGKVTHIAFAGVVGIGGPIFLIALVLLQGRPYFPLDWGRCFFVLLAAANAWLGSVAWKMVGQAYVFDGDAIRQLDRSGKMWKEISFTHITSIAFRTVRGTRSIQLQSGGVSMGVLLYPSLLREFERLSNQSSEPTLASGTSPAGQEPRLP